MVHESHGLGIYRGIEKIEQDKVVKDYIKIEYRDGGNLYLPATRLEGIQKYAGSDARTPKLNKLGGMEWNKTKSKVRGAVRDIAKDLVELYAARQRSEGYQYGPDTVWQRVRKCSVLRRRRISWRRSGDQKRWKAAASHGPPDLRRRIRQDGDQRSGRHLRRFRREAGCVSGADHNFGAAALQYLCAAEDERISQCGRYAVAFPHGGRAEKTLEDLKKGQVDVVIGTHRVLSKDVVFKNLASIIDEEQRFGVAHKEKIKKLRKNVDVLTLTATDLFIFSYSIIKFTITLPAPSGAPYASSHKSHLP